VLQRLGGARTRELNITALERLVQQTEDACDYRAALGYALRLVQDDPLQRPFAASLVSSPLLLRSKSLPRL
jgi:hypothetical protein